MKNLSQTKGFTLIELVVVIVILGILAATAAPKFIDLTDDARNSIVEGTRGSLNSAADMAHAKALVTGNANSSSAQVTAAGVTFDVVWGWPDSDEIVNLIDMDDITATPSGTGRVVFTHSDDTTNSCYAEYDVSGLSNAEDRPLIQTTGC